MGGNQTTINNWVDDKIAQALGRFGNSDMNLVHLGYGCTYRDINTNNIFVGVVSGWAGSGVLGITTTKTEGGESPEIKWAVSLIYADWGGFSIQGAYEKSFELILLHELGHAIGLDENAGGDATVDVMYASPAPLLWPGAVAFSGTEISSIETVYGKADKVGCPDSPAFFGRVACTFGSGVTLSVETLSVRLRNELILPASSNLTVDGDAKWATGCHARGAALAKVLAETAQERRQ